MTSALMGHWLVDLHISVISGCILERITFRLTLRTTLHSQVRKVVTVKKYDGFTLLQIFTC